MYVTFAFVGERNSSISISHQISVKEDKMYVCIDAIYNIQLQISIRLIVTYPLFSVIM